MSGARLRPITSMVVAVSRAQTEAFGVAPTRRRDLGTPGPGIGEKEGLLCDLERACFHVSAGPVRRPGDDRWCARKAPIAAAAGLTAWLRSAEANRTTSSSRLMPITTGRAERIRPLRR